MIDSKLDFFAVERRRRVRLGTLALLGWVTCFGQLAAVFVASEFLHLQLPIGPIAVTLAASFIACLAFSIVGRYSRRIGGNHVALVLGFDLVQLSALLMLTGGYDNPFTLLMLVPITISATMLRRQLTLILWGLSLVLIAVIGIWNWPLLDAAGNVITIPDILKVGNFAAMCIGVTFMALYTHRVTSELVDLALGLSAAQMALERAQKLSDIGGIVAATAHELGTPLATIKITAKEMFEELASLKDVPAELADDATLIADSVDRCRDILRSMGHAGKDDKQVKSAPLEEVLREAAEPHMGRGKQISIILPEGDRRAQPVLIRRPEIIHGLRNLVQNAVDFAENEVEIRSAWTNRRLVLRICDDGAGYPQLLMSRLGDPMPRRRKTEEEGTRRAGYEGMGLGLFIARTLLEHTGARLSFANGGPGTGLPGGAMAIVDWPRDVIEADPGIFGFNGARRAAGA